jgi:hypothetical protein
MKWYEFQVDNGDGTSCAWRFRTKEEAQTARDHMNKVSWFQTDGDGSPVTEEDTDSSHFFMTAQEVINEYSHD